MTTPTYAVLLDVGADWPDVVFIGDHGDAWAYVTSTIDGRDLPFTVTAVVSADEAIALTHFSKQP